jgi:riboflavin kinase / FMN adenylyltransferase
MNIIRGVPEQGSLHSPVITLGSFDGVHLGHRRIFSMVLNIARQKGGDPAVITFTSHPRKVLTPKTPPKILTTVDEKIRVIGECGIENVFLLDFTPEMAAMNAADFFNEFVHKRLRVIDMVVGYDHAFGRNREGNFEFIKELSKTRGFGVTRVEPKNFYSRPISSTWIRTEIEDGNINLANQLLGRRYGLRGSVGGGAGRGRTLGFPTANIVPEDPDKIIPKDGVYAARAHLDGGPSFGGMLNIGTNPTFNGSDRTIEINLFDFSGDLYGRTMEIEFIERIRDEQRFSGPDELVKQLERDRLAALYIFENMENLGE